MSLSMTSDMLLVVAELGRVLDQALVLLGIVLGLDDGLVLLDLDLVLDLLDLGLGQLALDRGDAPSVRPAATARDRRPRAAGAVEDLEIEHGTAGRADDRGAAEVVEAGATALADPLRAPFGLGQTAFSGGRSQSERGQLP